MKTLVYSLVGLAAIISLNSCNDTSDLTDTNLVDEKSALYNGVTCIDSTFTTTIDDLTEADIDGMMVMREEEKMAMDVYTYFYEKYELTIFSRIAESENRHAESMLNLLTHFGLEDPSSTETGVFNNSELQSLYNEIIALGDESVEAALSAGALIEETDIEDLDLLLENTANADLTKVYTNLLRGSYNHMKGFVKTLEAYDITYAPQVLTQEEFEAILATSNGNGHKGKGQGNGQKGGKGGKGGNSGRGGNNGQGTGNGTGTCING